MFAGSHLGQRIYGQRFLEVGQTTMYASFKVVGSKAVQRDVLRPQLFAST